jgi:hypothetical protein
VKTANPYGMHDGSGFVAPVTSGSRPLGVERVKERFVAPTTVPSTGAVRPQVAVAPRATAAMTPTVDNGQIQLGVRSWGPPA